MLKLICNIEIKGKDTTISFDCVNSIEVNTSLQDLVDTAKVKIPLKMHRGGKPLSEYIATGDAITIQTGYREYGLETIFKGYITGMEKSELLTIDCSNEMWKLRDVIFKPQKIEQFDIEQFMRENVKNIKMAVSDSIAFYGMDFNSSMSLTKVLEAIMQAYPYARCCFMDDVLHVMEKTKPYETARTAVFSPKNNMVYWKNDDSTGKNLRYIPAEDGEAAVKTTAILYDNRKVEGYAPKEAFTADSKGRTVVKAGYQLKTQDCPHCHDQASVQAFADQAMAVWATGMMDGAFKAFGIPFVRKGDKVELRDIEQLDGQTKQFLVKAVEYSFGQSGYRQTISPGYEI
jgi:hypothetical protein